MWVRMAFIVVTVLLKAREKITSKVNDNASERQMIDDGEFPPALTLS